MPFSARDFIHANHAHPPHDKADAPALSCGGAQFLLGDPHASFEGISIDTRTLRPGDLFLAIPGPRHDGHDHLGEALQKGAAGLVIEKLDERIPFNRMNVPSLFQVPHSITAIQQWARYLRQRSKAAFIGLTGTNGKTTTKEMTAAILSRLGKTLVTRGNLNNHLGLPLTLSRLEEDHKFAVLEMGASREGDIALLADIAQPHIGLITNIGKAHLQGLGSPEGVLKEKRALLDRLSKDGIAVINQDDPLIAGIAGRLPCRKLFFGLTALADVRAESIQDEEGAVRFTLHVRGERAPVRLSVPGQFQVMNALAAAAIAHAAGASLEDIVLGLTAFEPAAMRMQVLPHASGALLINDAYNANPSSVRASVHSFVRSYAGRTRWLVLGDMRELGGEAAKEHRELGVWLAAQPLERVLLYGRDTRFVQAALKTQSSTVRVDRFRKKRLLIEELRQTLASKPVVLFKGSRSMKLEDAISPLLK